jgi:uncharacterized protein
MNFPNFFEREAPHVEVSLMRSIMLQVYLLMTAALIVTATVAAVIASNDSLINSLIENPGLLLGVFLLQLVMVLALSFGLNRLSPTVAGVMFFVYAAMIGVTMSFILLTYTSESIAGAFGTTAALFGAMSIYGATTKSDLTKWRTYLFMGLIGLLIAMVVNIFLGSTMLEFLISVAGVIIFTALTAYDTQRIMWMAASVQDSSDRTTINRISIYGALHLYLDFINLFFYLLRLFGKRR